MYTKIGKPNIGDISSGFEEKGKSNKNKGYMEKRVESIGLPVIILPGKKSRETLDKWIETKMGDSPETWKGFLAYFDKEPVHEGKVDGYIIEMCSKTEKYDFEFKSRYYQINPHKFDKIEGNNNIEKKHEGSNLFQAYDYYMGDIRDNLFKMLSDNGIVEDSKDIYKETTEENKYNYLKKFNPIKHLKKMGAYLNFELNIKTGKNKRFDFNNAIANGDFELAEKLYLEALDVTNSVSENYFDIEGIDSVEVLKEKGAYLYFESDKTTKKSKRLKFNEAIANGDFELAKKLYLEALELTRNKLKRIGLTPEQNKFVIDCFRERNFEGIKKILEETKDVVGENMQVEDTEHKYSTVKINQDTGQKEIEYDNENKSKYKDPITGKEVLMTRRELHERIIEKFLLDGEASKGEKGLILSGGLPGSGKSTIEESLKHIPKVIINPDLVKDYLPEYYDESGRKFGAEIVHEESSYISKIIYDRAIKGGYTILYDSSMKDKPSEGFPKYNKIVQSAYEQGYLIEARFIYDGGEARYRNTVLRERSMGLKNYNAYGTAYKTIEYLSKDKRINKTIILDNSGNGRGLSQAKIVYENQKINMEESDADFIRRFKEYQSFLDEIL